MPIWFISRGVWLTSNFSNGLSFPNMVWSNLLWQTVRVVYIHVCIVMVHYVHFLGAWPNTPPAAHVYFLVCGLTTSSRISCCLVANEDLRKGKNIGIWRGYLTVCFYFLLLTQMNWEEITNDGNLTNSHLLPKLKYQIIPWPWCDAGVRFAWDPMRMETRYVYFHANTSITCHVWINGSKRFTGKLSRLAYPLVCLDFNRLCAASLQCLPTLPRRCLFKFRHPSPLVC